MILENYLKALNEDAAHSFQMYKKYGTVALLTAAPSTVYGFIFKSAKNGCGARCKRFQKDPVCWYQCYILAASYVIRAINKDKGSISTIPDPDQREKLRMQLKDEEMRWDDKIHTLKDKVTRMRDLKRIR